MNKVYYLAISIFVIFVLASTWVRAAFIPQAKLEQVVIKIADFVPPPAVDFIFTTKYFLPTLVKFEWNKVFDFGEKQKEAKYRLKFDNSIYETTNSYYEFNLSEFQEGEHKASIKACDEADNCSAWSPERTIVIDKLSPKLDILDQKRSEDGIYGYVKLKLIDDYSLKNISISPVINGGVLSFFDEGYFYNNWSEDFENDFWMVVQLLSDQQTTHLKVWDEAGNLVEKEIAW